MFSPGNLRATFDNPEYEKLLSYWIGEKYTLRYTGGMVPDVFQVQSHAYDFNLCLLKIHNGVRIARMPCLTLM